MQVTTKQLVEDMLAWVQEESPDETFPTPMDKLRFRFTFETNQFTETEIGDAEYLHMKFDEAGPFVEWIAPYMVEHGYRRNGNRRFRHPSLGKK